MEAREIIQKRINLHKREEQLIGEIKNCYEELGETVYESIGLPPQEVDLTSIAIKESDRSRFINSLSYAKQGHRNLQQIRQELKELDSIKLCPKCGKPRDYEGRFCTSCGFDYTGEYVDGGDRSVFRCRRCGTELETDALFCRKCGASINPGKSIWDLFNLDDLKGKVLGNRFLSANNRFFSINNLVSFIGSVLMILSFFLPYYTIRETYAYHLVSLTMPSINFVGVFPLIVSLVAIVLLIAGKEALYCFISFLGLGTTILVIYVNSLITKGVEKMLEAGFYLLIVGTAVMLIGAIMKIKKQLN